MNKEEIIEVVDDKIGLRGWVVIDSIRDGLSFGGLRMHPSVDLSVVRELAKSMTYKLAGHGLPVGGAKGGICADPRGPGFREKVRRFGEILAPVLRSRVVLGKDVGATDEWMRELYLGAGFAQLTPVQERARREQVSDPVPDEMGRLRGYIPKMTALGVVTAAQVAANGGLAGKRILIQGAGVVGSGVAHRITSLGARVVGISDHRRCAHRPEGFAARELEALLENGEVRPERAGKGCIEGESEALFGHDADLVVLAALSNTVDCSLANQIRAPIVVEGANFALLADARRSLHERGVLVVPDVIASSSSSAMVTLQMRSRNTLSEELLWKSILGSIERNTRHVMRIRERLEPREAFLAEMRSALESAE